MSVKILGAALAMPCGCDGVAADTDHELERTRLRVAPVAHVTPASHTQPRLDPVSDPALIRRLSPRAQQILEDHSDQPIGTEIPFEHAGHWYIARIEIHEHPYGGIEKPWGPHRGITVYTVSRR